MKHDKGIRGSVCRRAAVGIMTASMILSPMIVRAEEAGISQNMTAFEQQFRSPTDNDSKPFMRWWIAPGRMNEEEVYRQMKEFADGGYGGVELQCLELATADAPINSEKWNREIKWILQAGIEYGIQVDFTVGQMWPVATPDITDVDDIRTEQLLWDASTGFTASADNMTYQADTWVFPAGSSGQSRFDSNRSWELVAVTAAKQGENTDSYDPDTAIDVLADETTVYDDATGALTWTPPSEGNWTVFYFYRQSANHTTLMIGQYVIDHMGAEATQAVIDNWERAMDSDPELEALYEQNGGSIFGDSFELRSNLWTPNMLDEFEARRGYDLTPYLPAINYNFDQVDGRIIEDLYKTMTELLAENHMGKLSEWAHSHNMTLRYQAYSSAGTSPFELTYPALGTDIIEAESYAMSGDTPDAYRQLSGAVNMRGDKIYSAEAAEIGNDSWRETWTVTPEMKDGSENSYAGFMHYAYRLFAGGVNKLVFHGSTYHFTDTSGLIFAPPVITWPGYSAMAGMNYGNEWDDKTPMWENVDIMTDSLSRTQMVLQQGQADVDLAMYRNMYGKGNVRSEMTAVEQYGYTYDYVTPTVLKMDNAVTGTQNGNTVLAPEGPSYKALVIESLADGTVPTMPLDTASSILEYAKNGLPVVIIGEAPYHVDSYSAEGGADVSSDELAAGDARLVELMNELKGLSNVAVIGSRDELPGTLSEFGVAPDARTAEPSSNYFVHRAADEADYYFIYNDGEEADYTVTLKGNGTPYILDSWSGDITPVAEYEAADGSVTVSVELAHEDAAIIALASDGWAGSALDSYVMSTDADSAVYDTENGTAALRTSAGGELIAVMNDGTTKKVSADAAQEPITLSGWNMVLNQWTAGDGAYETVVVPGQTYDLSETGLVPWYDIDPENLTNVAGVAKYSTSFELEKGWAEGQGAYLDFTEVADVARVMVNGTEVPMNQISLHTDIGEYLTAGTNTINVDVSSNMSNVQFATNDSNTYSFGIVGDVTVIPYTQVALADIQEEPAQTDTADLEAAITKAESLTESDYTAESWSVLIDALNQAKAVLQSGGSQDEINAAAAALNSAVDGLISAEESTEDPGDTEKPDDTQNPDGTQNPDDTQNPGNSSSIGNAGNTGDSGKTGNSNGPRTGDEAEIIAAAGWGALVVICLGVTIVMVIKRKRLS